MEETRLRLRAQALTQLHAGERERMLALFRFVRRLPYAEGWRWRLRTPLEVLAAGCGDAADKTTLLLALLRGAGLTARVRYLLPERALGLGLVPLLPVPRPVVEVRLGEAWTGTDSHIHDLRYAAAARHALRGQARGRGYGVDAWMPLLWDGEADLVAGRVGAWRDLGAWKDPRAFVRACAAPRRWPLALLLLWGNLASPWAARVVRRLRPLAPAVR